MGLLVDSYGRRIKSMRISITDKCNFRCTYCMPAEGLPWLKKAEILSYEEIERIARVAVSIGIEQIRLTGGEPLVRRDVPELVRQLHKIEGLRSLSLTTNGVLLKQQAGALAAAGLTRINVSLASFFLQLFLIPDLLYQPGQSTVLRHLRPNSPGFRRAATHLPLCHLRDRPACCRSLQCFRRFTGLGHSPSCL